MLHPRVSIIIINWNGLSDTIECLNSLKKITYPNYEIIIVDNNSIGNDVDVLEKKYKNYIQVIRSEKNLGFAAGNNLGIKHVIKKNNCHYILLLNNDTLVKKFFLTKLVSFMENNKKSGITGPKIITNDGHVDKSCARRRPTIFDYIFRIGIGKIFFPNNLWTKKHYYSGYNFNYPKKVEVISGACMLFRLEAIKSIGLLDENTFLYLEEFIISEKIENTNWETYIVPESEIIHKMAKSSSKRKNTFLIKTQLKSLYRYLRIYKKYNIFIIIFLITNVFLLRLVSLMGLKLDVLCKKFRIQK